MSCFRQDRLGLASQLIDKLNWQTSRLNLVQLKLAKSSKLISIWICICICNCIGISNSVCNIVVVVVVELVSGLQLACSFIFECFQLEITWLSFCVLFSIVVAAKACNQTSNNCVVSVLIVAFDFSHSFCFVSLTANFY